MTNNSDPRDAIKPELKVLICLYTCADHLRFHDQFHLSNIGMFLKSINNSKLINVFADGAINSPLMQENDLYLDTKESYINLSLKTYKMIKYCVQRFEFQYLMKIDLSSGIEQLNTNPAVANRVRDQEVMVNFLGDVNTKIQERKLEDYTGWKLINANKDGIERWAKNRGLQIDFDHVFADEIIPPYFSGKCYLLSKAFANYVAKSGAVMAQEHTQHLTGSEDLMIGRLYDKFSLSNQHSVQPPLSDKLLSVLRT